MGRGGALRDYDQFNNPYLKGLGGLATAAYCFYLGVMRMVTPDTHIGMHMYVHGTDRIGYGVLDIFIGFICLLAGIAYFCDGLRDRRDAVTEPFDAFSEALGTVVLFSEPKVRGSMGSSAALYHLFLTDTELAVAGPLRTGQKGLHFALRAPRSDMQAERCSDGGMNVMVRIANHDGSESFWKFKLQNPQTFLELLGPPPASRS